MQGAASPSPDVTDMGHLLGEDLGDIVSWSHLGNLSGIKARHIGHRHKLVLGQIGASVDDGLAVVLHYQGDRHLIGGHIGALGLITTKQGHGLEEIAFMITFLNRL